MPSWLAESQPQRSRVPGRGFVPATPFKGGSSVFALLQGIQSSRHCCLGSNAREHHEVERVGGVQMFCKHCSVSIACTRSLFQMLNFARRKCKRAAQASADTELDTGAFLCFGYFLSFCLLPLSCRFCVLWCFLQFETIFPVSCLHW